MSSIGHPVVGDSLYRAPKELRRATALRKTATKAASRAARPPEAAPAPSVLAPDRNFLHAAAVEFIHPRSGKALTFSAPLPRELMVFLEQLRG
jgi:23S rRNA pseudouridine1911/1915/1917 synthase